MCTYSQKYTTFTVLHLSIWYVPAVWGQVFNLFMDCVRLGAGKPWEPVATRGFSSKLIDWVLFSLCIMGPAVKQCGASGRQCDVLPIERLLGLPNLNIRCRLSIWLIGGRSSPARAKYSVSMQIPYIKMTMCVFPAANKCYRSLHQDNHDQGQKKCQEHEAILAEPRWERHTNTISWFLFWNR